MKEENVAPTQAERVFYALLTRAGKTASISGIAEHALTVCGILNGTQKDESTVTTTLTAEQMDKDVVSTGTPAKGKANVAPRDESIPEVAKKKAAPKKKKEEPQPATSAGPTPDLKQLISDVGVIAKELGPRATELHDLMKGKYKVTKVSELDPRQYAEFLADCRIVAA